MYQVFSPDGFAIATLGVEKIERDQIQEYKKLLAIKI